MCIRDRLVSASTNKCTSSRSHLILQQTAYDLSLRLKSAGIDPVVIQGFSSSFLTNDAQLDDILKEDVRIIFGIFGSKGARRIFCRVSDNVDIYFKNLLL